MWNKFLIRNIIWAIVIFILCAIPGKDLPETTLVRIPHFDKIVHFGMFFIMGIFLYSELSIQTSLNRGKKIWISLSIIISYGAIIEYLQENYFISRSGDYVDLLADAFGGFIAVLMYPFLKKQKDLLLNSKPLNQISFLKRIL
jgi:VanZ family protein